MFSTGPPFANCCTSEGPLRCYLALSEAQDVPLVTADRKLVRKLAGTPFAGRTLHSADAASR